MNTKSAAQREISLPHELEAEPLELLGAHDPYGQFELKAQVAERLAAHRARRARQAPASLQDADPGRPGRRPNAIAAAVAERYAQTPSYHSFLAEEAERATRQAAAAAEIAQRNADAVASAQQQLLEELDLWNREPSDSLGPIPVPPEPARREHPVYQQPIAPGNTPTREVSSAGLTVRLYEDLGPGVPLAVQTNRITLASDDADEHLALDEEIAFRKAPVFEEAATPPVPIPANLLEFPRQLVATRKARPVFALGPLRETVAPTSGQLRIFEVEPEQISPDPPAPVAEPVWTSIWLDTPAPVAPLAEPEPATEPRLKVSKPVAAPEPAGLGRRVMSASVDCILVLTAFVCFATALIAVAGTLPTGTTLALAALGTLAAFGLLYHFLFFTFSDHTPGMRYARIGLCTLSDENPTRAQMRGRLIPTLLALSPLGLGLLWALLDQDHLGWHDRLSKTYQREY